MTPWSTDARRQIAELTTCTSYPAVRTGLLTAPRRGGGPSRSTRPVAVVDVMRREA